MKLFRRSCDELGQTILLVTHNAHGPPQTQPAPTKVHFLKDASSTRSTAGGEQVTPAAIAALAGGAGDSEGAACADLLLAWRHLVFRPRPTLLSVLRHRAGQSPHPVLGARRSNHNTLAQPHCAAISRDPDSDLADPACRPRPATTTPKAAALRTASAPAAHVTGFATVNGKPCPASGRARTGKSS
jgi:hypothetical protein